MSPATDAVFVVEETDETTVDGRPEQRQVRPTRHGWRSDAPPRRRAREG